MEDGSFQNIPLSEAQPYACYLRNPSDLLFRPKGDKHGPVRMRCPLWSFHSTHLCPWPKASEASRGLSVEQAALNSSHSWEVATS